MNFQRASSSIFGGLAAVSLVAVIPANAQQGEDLGSLVNQSLAAMNAEKWEEALGILNHAVERYGKNEPLKLFGAQFGVIYYRKGICEMKLRKWDEAIASLEICYRDFPNPEGGRGGNVFQKRALLKWGEAAMGKEDWELAIKQFQKFLAERDKVRDTYPQGLFHVNMAICHYKLGRITEGNQNLETAIKNKASFPTPDAAIVSGFQALVGAVVTGGKEQALLDFIAKNRGDIIIEPFEMQPFAPVYMKLAADAIGADMPRAALELYQMIPSTDEVIDDLRARSASLAGRPGMRDGGRNLVKKRLDDTLAALEADRRAQKGNEVTKLAATAFIHEKNGNIRGAYAAYRQLDAHYPKAAKREEHLYHLVRTSSMLGETAVTEENARKLLRAFPQSAHASDARRILLSTLFYDGRYESCITTAAGMIGTLEEGSKDRDICLHVLGGSYYYTGQYDKAQPLLDEHVEKFPESQFAMAAAYFQASNLSRLQFWAKSGKLLDEFIAKYPDGSQNIFLPFALFDRANCHYALEENDAALEKIARISKEFPNSKIADVALGLKGNIHQTAGDNESAEKSFIRALKLAESRNNSVVAGEALYYLVVFLGDPANDRLKEAVPYADTFWDKYADESPFKARFALAQIKAFQAVGRGQEGLDRLRDVISDLAKEPEADGLEEAINAYTEVYLENHTPEELRAHYNTFPGIGSEQKAARALLRIALIGAYENVARKSEGDAERVRNAKAIVQVLFQELKTEFAPKDLSNFILVKLGDYLRTNTATPLEALPFYDEVLSRKDTDNRFAALFGRADVFGRSKSSADLDKALADFETVYNESEVRGERESALFRIIETQFAKGDHEKAADNAKLYLDKEKSGFTKHTAEVGLLLARTYQERKMRDDAIAMYVKVWSAHMGHVKVSAPAVKAWMELSWERNQKGNPDAMPPVPGDRQGAYEGGARYIELTSRFKDKLTAEELAAWQEVEKLVKVYEADASIKSVAQLKREAEAARGR